MAAEKFGRITQVIGAVLDIRFQAGELPLINEAIRIKREDGGELVAEVSQHLGDDTVRCIAMGSTDGLRRGMEAIATGAAISVPVGENTLGRMFNVLGQPIDENRCRRESALSRSTAAHRNLRISRQKRKCWKPVLKSLTCFALIRRVVRPVCSAAPA